jgi:hypothetical protein
MLPANDHPMTPHIYKQRFCSREAAEGLEGRGNCRGRQFPDRDVVATEPPNELLHAGNEAAKLSTGTATIGRADHRAVCRHPLAPSAWVCFDNASFILFWSATAQA